MRASSLLAFRCYFELPSINKDFTSLHFTSYCILKDNNNNNNNSKNIKRYTGENNPLLINIKNTYFTIFITLDSNNITILK